MPIRTWWRETGRVTRVLVGLLVIVHVVLCRAYEGEPHGHIVVVGLNPALLHALWNARCWWPLVRHLYGSAFAHVDLLHLILNTSSLWESGTALEHPTALGSKCFVLLVFFSTIVKGLVYTGTAFVLHVTGVLPELYSQWVVGFSGVLYAMMVVEAYCRRQPVTLFWNVKVPSNVYPFVSLVITQILFRRTSFFGHASDAEGRYSGAYHH